MALRGIRGAITVKENSEEEIYHAAQFLVTKIMSANMLSPSEVGAIIFSSTKDLTAAFPSTGVRKMSGGFHLVPLFDTVEPDVKNSLPMCVRVLILLDSDKAPEEIYHVYEGGAKNLRPDLA